jgi:tetratricopeptide (TPR) repeat protein
MSSNSADEEADEVCVNCGQAAVDDTNLKLCACLLVKYCSVDCQLTHRPQHKKACKKRMTEIRDRSLFQQPDISHFGECPLCCLPLSLDWSKSGKRTCCSKWVCMGCVYANKKREMEQGLEHKCPFCREPDAKTKAQRHKNSMKRVKANDPVAICEVGKEHRDRGQYDAAFAYFKKAAELGLADAHFNLSVLYRKGQGVGVDLKKEEHHLEEASISGHPEARNNLAIIEQRRGRIDRAMQHWIITAKLGLDAGLGAVKKGFAHGVVSKEDYEAALRGHQDAVDATKSQQREEAEIMRVNADMFCYIEH